MAVKVWVAKLCQEYGGYLRKIAHSYKTPAPIIDWRTLAHYSNYSSVPVHLRSSSTLPAWHRIWSITWPRKIWRSIGIPAELLRSNCSIRPASIVNLHAMVHNPELAIIRTCGKTCVANAIRLLLWIHVEDTTFGMLLPRRRIHGVRANQLQLTQAIILVI